MNHDQYAIDNEIHHRGQAFVYLRALNIEPPSFWQRDGRTAPKHTSRAAQDHYLQHESHLTDP